MSIVPALYAEGQAARDVRVTEATGQVTVKTSDHPKQAAAVDEETPLMDQDVIETGPKSTAEITMDGETVFKLQPDSRLQIKKLFQQNTQLELTQGAMLAKVKPAAGPDHALIVKMPTAVAAIRGTEFAAETGHGVSHIGVFDEGHVVVAGAWGHEHVKLAPNQETKVTLSNVPQSPHPLAHFKTYRNQIQGLRSRATYWRKNWSPMSVVRKQDIRDRLADPRRPLSLTFRHPPKPKPIHRAVRKRRPHARKQPSLKKSMPPQPTTPPNS